jgi:S1-C subfamily serine protease
VKAQFKFLSGARAGQVEAFEKAYLGLGRHPLSDVRFDTERDLDVSARHAAVLKRPEGYVLQDLGSKNGTYVNGERLAGDRVLADGDVIGFGAKGPALEFHLLLDGTVDRSTAGAEALAARVSQPRQSFPAAPPPVKARTSTAVRIAAEVARQTRQLRATTKILMGTLAGVVVLAGFVLWKGAQDRQHELQRIQTWADSVAAAARSREKEFQNQVEGLKAAYTQSLAEVERLRGELNQAGSDPATVIRLRNELEAARVRQQGILGAANVDYRAISTANENAVGIVVVDRGNHDVVSGTAFSVDSQATFVTNKHVLVGEDGDKTPQQIVVKFSGSSQWFKARFIGVADSADIGVFKIDGLKGGSPRVEGIERDPHTLQRGDPVAIIGYPLGMDLPMPGQGNEAVAEPSLTVGTASKVLNNVIQVDGYGAPGSSGSPIFDRNGHVVAVLYGGVTESNGKIILAVPVTAVVEYLSKVGVAVR